MSDRSSSLRGIVFDLDGVLVDSEPLHCRAIRAALQPLGVSFGDDEYVRELMGLDDRDLFRRAFELRGRPIPVERFPDLVRTKTAELTRIVAAGVAAPAGALELLRESAASMPVALCSGSRRQEIELLLAALGKDVRALFQAIVSADDVRASKPDPGGYRRAVAALELDPAVCLAIEDTPTGVAAARAAGMRVLAVATIGGAERLANADRVVTDLAGVGMPELRRWFA